MDVILRTNDPNCSLMFRDARRFADASGMCAHVSARSGAFAGAQFVCMHPALFERFVAAIETMDRELDGSARFQSDFEGHYVELSVSRTGHVRVVGELYEYGPETQHLRFEFTTDQTCLGPFVADLRAWMGLPSS